MTAAIDYRRLLGRLIQVDLDGRRLLRVVGIDAGRRKGLRLIRAAGSSYEGRRADGRDRWGWHGRVHRIHMMPGVGDAPSGPVSARRRTAHSGFLCLDGVRVLGVLYRRRIVPVSEFCRTNQTPSP